MVGPKRAKDQRIGRPIRSPFYTFFFGNQGFSLFRAFLFRVRAPLHPGQETVNFLTIPLMVSTRYRALFPS